MGWKGNKHGLQLLLWCLTIEYSFDAVLPKQVLMFTGKQDRLVLSKHCPIQTHGDRQEKEEERTMRDQHVCVCVCAPLSPKMQPKDPPIIPANNIDSSIVHKVPHTIFPYRIQ